ncbi:uncharacterized protein LOC120119775 [Hibiscus syriacus]|uniref:uncharacterized protein LOC120119775 n=1 Tax=Hibiscus syriacus TaxID=106335 RepID=UPI001923A2D1|nr:uncharacterized protein LOC120119775 [Hibiscus syriacus]
MADKDYSGPIPDRWMLVVKKQKDGSSLSYYICPESGQKFYSYEDLMRYVNYAQTAKLSIYAADFCPGKPSRRSKKRASWPEPSEKSSDSDDSTFELPDIAPLDLLDEMSPAESEKQSASIKMKLERKAAPNEDCSGSMGKAKKQKK